MLPDQIDMTYHMPFLEKLASMSSVIIEIGVGHGNGSTRAFTRGLKRSNHPEIHVLVDSNPTGPEEMPQSDTYKVYKVTGDSRDPATLELVVLELGLSNPDIIFIDTEHTYEILAAELSLWSTLATPLTTWVFHDTHMFGFYNSMTEAIKDFCKANPEWEFIDYTSECHGLGIMKHTKVRPIWED